MFLENKVLRSHRNLPAYSYAVWVIRSCRKQKVRQRIECMEWGVDAEPRCIWIHWVSPSQQRKCVNFCKKWFTLKASLLDCLFLFTSSSRQRPISNILSEMLPLKRHRFHTNICCFHSFFKCIHLCCHGHHSASVG